MLKRKGFAAGGLLVQLLIYCMIAGVITTSLVTLQSSNFSSLAAGRVELEAQQWADIRANVVRAIGFYSIQSQPRKPIDGSNNVWEDEVIVGPEQIIAPDHKQKIVTVKVYKTGDSIEKFALKVPLSSQDSNTLPKGTIVAFTGDVNKIPHGWQLCDGTNGTPDLRDRFLAGAGLNYYPNQIGGQNIVTLQTENLPQNAFNNSFGNKYLLASMTGTYTFGTIENMSLIVHSQHGTNGKSGFNWIQVGNAISSSNWIGQPFDIRPLFYAVYYIMKV